MKKKNKGKSIKLTEKVLLNKTLVRKIVRLLNKGLSHGLGKPVPGQMCVEALICYVLGLPHGDNPPCVDRELIVMKIRLNDQEWSSKKVRAEGMARLAVMQLGTNSDFNIEKFTQKLRLAIVKKFIPFVLERKMEDSREQLKEDKTSVALLRKAIGILRKATYPSRNQAIENARGIIHGIAIEEIANLFDDFYCSYRWVIDRGDADSLACVVDGADDASLTFFAEVAVQILIEMKVPAVEFLPLLPKPKFKV